MRSVAVVLDNYIYVDYFDECRISPLERDMRTVHLAPGVTLTRPG